MSEIKKNESESQNQPEKSEHELMYEKLDDWKDSDIFPGIKYSEKGEFFWCPTHRKCLSKGPMKMHMRVHMKGYGSKKIQNNPLMKKLEESSQDKTEDPDLVTTPSTMVLEDVNKDIAEAGSMIAKDYELRAEYQKLHELDMIPWDWTFYDWIKLGCVQVWNKQFGCKLKLDVNFLNYSPEQRELVKTIMKENARRKKEDSVDFGF